MAGSGGTGSVLRLRLAGEESPDPRERAVRSHVVSVVFTADLEEWRRGWGAETPAREAVVSVDDPTRSASAAGPTQLFPAPDLAYTMLGELDGIDIVLRTVEEYLAETTGSELTVLVDDVAPVLDAYGPATLRQFLEQLSAIADSVDGTVAVGCSMTPDLVRAVASITPVIDEVHGVAPELTEAVDRLRRSDPTTFGYTRRYWAEASRGIDACTRNYPQAKQIHTALSDPETTPRTLGATLTGLVELGVLGTWGDTVGPTRYDLTAYDPVRAARIGFVLAGAADASSPRLVHDS